MHLRPSISTALLAALVLSATACQEMIMANETDHARIEIMRTDPVYADTVDEWIDEGSLLVSEGTHRGNGFIGHFDPWHGEQPPPDDMVGPRLREPVQEVLKDLRDGGWTIIGTRCTIEIATDDGDDSDSDGGDHATDERPVRHGWYAHGYRIHDLVPYVVVVEANHPRDAGRPTALRVWMSSPLHTDPETDTYFQPRPPELEVGGSCIERGDHLPDEGPPEAADVADGLGWQPIWRTPYARPFPAEAPSPAPSPGS